MAKRASGNLMARIETSRAKYSAGQRLLSQRAPGCNAIHRSEGWGGFFSMDSLASPNHLRFTFTATNGRSGSQLKSVWTGTPSGGNTERYQSTAWVWKLLRGTATS